MRIFKENQRFRQLWLIILMIVSAIIPLGIIIGSYVKNNNSFSPIELVIIILVVLLSTGIVFLFKLTTRIDENGIHYKFFPFHFSFKTLPWNTIIKAYVRKYDALNEYGGWGIKGGSLWNKSKGKAINVSGDLGIQLELSNGKKLLIGTQKENEVNTILKTYQNKLS